MGETLMTLQPKTDFEKLLWEKSENKRLKEELRLSNLKNGELLSRIDELKFDLSKDSVGQLQLKITKYKINIIKLNSVIRKLRVDNNNLLNKLAINNIENGKNKQTKP